jgi:hypothetical protein
MPVVLLMRHGEKYEDELSDAGEIRASYLPTYFRNFRPSGVPFPTHLISMKPKKHSSWRCVETLLPMSKEFHMPLHILFHREETRELVDYVKKLPHDAVSLICWEHKAIVTIAREFGFPALNWNDRPFSNHVDTKVFNVLWAIHGDEFESYHTFGVDSGHISHYLHPLVQKYVKT